MNKLVQIALLMLIICAANAQIYKWTDSKGNVHFTDVPHDGAEQIKLPESQTYSAPVVPVDTVKETLETEEKAKQRTYTKVLITQPDNEATIRNNQGYVEITVQLEPELTPGDLVQLLIDGSPVGEPQAGLSFQVSGIDRGAHTVGVQVVTAAGTVISSSETNTFFMHRPRVGMGAGVKRGGGN